MKKTVHIIVYTISIGIAVALAVWSLIIFCEGIMLPVDLHGIDKESWNWFYTALGHAGIFILAALVESVVLLIVEAIILAITRTKKPIKTASLIALSFLSIVIIVIVITSIIFLVVKPNCNPLV